MIIGIITGIVVLTLLVVAHELGHALVARRYGTVVEEFGIGFPPKVWGRKVRKSFLGDNVLFSINLLPLGGFVRMQGEHDSDNEKGDYGRMTFKQKTFTLLAGVAVNWIIAVILLTILAWTGLPKMLPNQFMINSDAKVSTSPVFLSFVSPGMPTDKAGLKVNDEIIKINNQNIVDLSQVSQITKDQKGKTIEVIYKRDGIIKKASIEVRNNNDDKKGYIGASPSQASPIIRTTWSAPIVGLGTTVQMTAVTLQGLGQVIVDSLSSVIMRFSPNQETRIKADEIISKVGDSVGGPLTIFGILFPAAQKAGFTYVIMIGAIISLTLAVMNILPFPALDGGRWFVTFIYRLRKKELAPEIEEKIHGTGFLILMILVVLVTIADVGKF